VDAARRCSRDEEIAFAVFCRLGDQDRWGLHRPGCDTIPSSVSIGVSGIGGQNHVAARAGRARAAGGIDLAKLKVVKPSRARADVTTAVIGGPCSRAPRRRASPIAPAGPGPGRHAGHRHFVGAQNWRRLGGRVPTLGASRASMRHSRIGAAIIGPKAMTPEQVAVIWDDVFAKTMGDRRKWKDEIQRSQPHQPDTCRAVAATAVPGDGETRS